MYHRPLWCSLCCILLVFKGLTQNSPCDCAEEQRLRPDIIRYFNSGKMDSAVVLFNQIRATGLPGCRISYCDAMAQYHINKNQLSEVEVLLREERRLLDSLHCSARAFARYHNTEGSYHLANMNREAAVSSFLEALRFTEAVNDLVGQQRALLNLGALFSQLSQHDKSFSYYKRAERIVQQIKQPALLADIQSRLASAYNNFFQRAKQTALLDTALIFSAEAQKNARASGNKVVLCDAWISTATTLQLQRKFAEALPFTDSLMVNMPYAMRAKLRYLTFGLKSALYEELGQLSISAAYADSTVAAARAFNPISLITAYEQMFGVHKLMGNTDKALDAYMKMTVLKDSILNIEKFNRINELEEKYNKVQNEKNIKELSQEREIILLRNRQLLLGVLLAVMAMAGLIFWQRQRNLKAKQAALETEQRLNRARMNPHFFFNALSALQGLIIRSGDMRPVLSYLSKFSSIMRQTLESTYTENVTIAQEREYLAQYLDLQQLRFPEKFDYHIEVDERIDEENTLLPPMLVQPFAENAIEHGFGDANAVNRLEIRIFKQGDNRLILEIEDNGRGLEEGPNNKKEHTSRATQIVRDRLTLIRQKHRGDAGLEVKNLTEGGVLARISLPLLS
jgi:two-component sensor histidine kinase